MAKKKVYKTKNYYQKREPPRRNLWVVFPKKLFWGIEAVAAMEKWSLSKTVVEIVKQVLDPEHKIVK